RLPRLFGDRAERHDPPVADPDVGSARRRAGAVDDHPAPDHAVEHGSILRTGVTVAPSRGVNSRRFDHLAARLAAWSASRRLAWAASLALRSRTAASRRSALLALRFSSTSVRSGSSVFGARATSPKL